MALLPSPIFLREADRAGPIACGNGCGFVQKEYAVLHISTPRNRLQRRAAIETTVEFAVAMTSQRTGDGTKVWFPIRPDESECLFKRGLATSRLQHHRASWNVSSTPM